MCSNSSVSIFRLLPALGLLTSVPMTDSGPLCGGWATYPSLTFRRALKSSMAWPHHQLNEHPPELCGLGALAVGQTSKLPHHKPHHHSPLLHLQQSPGQGVLIGWASLSGNQEGLWGACNNSATSISHQSPNHNRVLQSQMINGYCGVHKETITAKVVNFW